MKKRSVAFGIVAFVLLATFAYVNALQCPPNSHTWGGDTETSDLVYCIPDVGPSGPVNPDQTPESDTDEGQPSDTGDYSDLSLEELYEKWDEEGCRWGRTDEEGQAICRKISAAIDEKLSAPSEEETEEEEEEVPEEETEEEEEIPWDEEEPEIEEEVLPEEETPVETPEETPEEEDFPSEEGKRMMDEIMKAAVEGTFERQRREALNLQNYWKTHDELVREVEAAIKEAAQNRFDATQPLVLDVVNAKNDYQDALKEVESKEELAELKSVYDVKAEELKSELIRVLNSDEGNVDALWGMAVVNRWQGNNEIAYEYYRDALVSQQHRNVFKYDGLLDKVRDPAMRMRLMQDLAPNENIINVPTTETSPFLKWFDDNTDARVQQVSKVKRQFAEQIEKIANAFSLSNYLPKKLEEINGQ